MSRPDIFYQPPKGENSGLPHDPFKSFIIPRPIGWISTTSKSGQDNLAPFSQFNNVSFDPQLSCLSDINQSTNATAKIPSTTPKTPENSFGTWLRTTFAKTSTPPPSNHGTTSSPRESNESHQQSSEATQRDSLVGHSDIVIGRVVGIHVRGEYITPDGLFDVLKAGPLARLGYHQYTAINNIFDMDMPFMPDDHVGGNTLGGVVSKNIDEDAVVVNETKQRRSSLKVNWH
ncbi:hypothetical protein EYC80_003478 [Monilinia laxa]|uniref:Flavin reductase like domain-containing protein n=1 Tax=Monilinia laxa TaxID=61186 RepID=A0A5N6KE11_MONLA|nr:hypothetical protein EYC80_003478 [Monilinia laxa]